MAGLYEQLRGGNKLSYRRDGFTLKKVRDAFRDYFYPKRVWAAKALERMEEEGIEDKKMKELLKEMING